MSWIAVAGICAVAVVLQLLGDRWWPSLLVLFGPRWIAALFPLATLPHFLAMPRRGLLPALIATLVFVFGVMDLRVGIGRFGTPNGVAIRVIEFNMAGSAADEAATVTWMRAMRPAVIFLVECKPDRGRRIADELRMHAATSGSLCLLSTHPIDNWMPRAQGEFWKRYGSGAIARATIRHPDASFNVGIVHLATPRHVLDTFGDLSELPFRGPAVAANIALRNEESTAAKEWIGDPRDVDLVGGDFNLPIESAVYRRHWGDFTNAFSSVGTGLGRTKRTRLIGVRIDHLLVGSRLAARIASIGPDLGSDHRPLVVEVVVRQAPLSERRRLDIP